MHISKKCCTFALEIGNQGDIYIIPENTLNEDEIILSKYSYDNVGCLVQNLLCNKQDTIHYSYDMRNMLTETRNRHFTERLFYADSLPLYAYSFETDRLWQITIACDSDILLPILRRDSGAADTRVSGKYFYHTDHLGSANWVTKGDEAVQFIHYMPYGEMWYNQRGSAYNERYKYTGKERDEETGNDYFGARYYAPNTPMWLSPDPLMDKYPGISPYAYCHWNPVKYVDIDGNYPIIPLYFAYYATAKVLENSSGDRDLRSIGYAMQHPINS